MEIGRVRPNTLIFDLSEVLISGLIGIEPELSTMLGVPREAVRNAFLDNKLDDWLRGDITEDTYLDLVIACEKWRVDPSAIKELICRALQHRIPGMEELVVRLSRSYELVLFSDHAREYGDYIITTHPFLLCFRTRVFSYELRKTKQDMSSFTQVLGIIGRKPCECVYIDDSQSNVERASMVGIPSVLFMSCGKLVKSLASMGLGL